MALAYIIRLNSELITLGEMQMIYHTSHIYIGKISLKMRNCDSIFCGKALVSLAHC